QVELKEIRTTGDRILDVPLSEIGEKALFTKELDLALLDGSIQIAVHSLKDLPTNLPSGIRIGAVTEREDARDVFVARSGFPVTFSGLPHGAIIATSSLRRMAQIKAWRPDIRIESIRGNVDTRLNKLDASNWHGIILAAAGLNRLGLHARITEFVDPAIMLPAVGQGALAVVCAEEDSATYATLRETLHHEPTGAATLAERAFLRRLEGGCSVPVGAYGTVTATTVSLSGCVAALDGSRVLRSEITGPVAQAELLGSTLAQRLIDDGAAEILRAIRESK
ncbi:MAG: hydroxymethylbilane synthase, partial [Rhodothermales bacterium]